MPIDFKKKHPLERLVQLLAIAIKAKVSAIMVGNPGWAKTDLVEATAKEMKHFFAKYEVPGTVDSTQFEGLPHFGGAEEKRWVEHIPYKYLLDLADAAASVFFIDDLAEANAEIQARFLKVLHGRKIGDRSYPNTAFVAAANPEGGELMISDALHNRILLIPWIFPCHDVGMAFINNFPSPEVPTFDPDWEKKYLTHRLQQIGGYIMTLDDMLMMADEKAVSTRGPHMSPRSSHYVGRLMAAYDGAVFRGKKLIDPEIELLILNGCIGEIAASAYLAWIDLDKRPTADEILENPKSLESCAMDDAGLSLLYTLIGIVGRHVVRQNDEKSWKQGCKLAGYLADKGKKSVGVNLAIALHEGRPAGLKQDPKELLAYSDSFAATSSV